MVLPQKTFSMGGIKLQLSVGVNRKHPLWLMAGSIKVATKHVRNYIPLRNHYELIDPENLTKIK